MQPRESFIAELVILAVIVIVLVLRFWVIRHQRRGTEDWFRDVFFATSTFLCMGTTSCLAWYCWKSMEVYQQATLVVDQKIAEAAKNSTIDLTSMTAAQLEALQSQIREERDANIELMATVMLLDPSYRRFLFFIWGGYFTELWLLKGAFLAFYWRLFSRVQSRFVYLLYGTTVFVIITYIIVLTIHFTWCTPVHRNWTVPLEEFPGTSSINSLTTLTVGSFLNIATDLLILILPLLIVQSFKLRRREMLGLCFIFTVGIMCVTASVVRYVNMYIPYKAPPATMEGVRVAFLWSSLEVMTGFIAFCLPSFRLVLFRAFKRGRDTILHKRRSSAHGLPRVAGYSTGGFSDPKHPSLGSSATKSKKKNLPRHPNTLLTVDFVTLNTIMSRDEEGGPMVQDSIMYPPNALTRQGESIQTRIGVHPEGTYSYPHEPNGIQVTNTISVSTSVAEESDTPPNHSFPSPSPNGSRVRHQHIHHPSYDSSQRTTPTPTPPPASLVAVSAAEEHGEEYVLMPMQRAYDPSAAHTGSRENLRPTSRNGPYGPGR